MNASLTRSPLPLPPFPAARAFASVLGAGVIGIASSMGLAYAVGQPGWALPAALTGGGCALGSLSAMEAVRRAVPYGHERLVLATLGGFALRLVGAAVGAGVAIGAFEASRLSTGVWLAGWYLIFLLIDVAILRSFYKMLTPLTQGTQPAPSETTAPAPPAPPANPDTETRP